MSVVSRTVTNDHFYEPLHKTIFAVLSDLIAQGKTANPITAKSFLPQDDIVGGLTVPQYLVRLAAEAVTIINAPDYAQAVFDCYVRRAAMGVAENLTANAMRFDPECAPRVILEDAERRLADLRGMCAVHERQTRHKIAEAAHSAIQSGMEAKQRGNALTGLTWGLTDLNRLTGGIQKRDFTIIAARPSMGKTSVGISVARTLAIKGHSTLFFSLEMDAAKLAARALTDQAYQWAKIPYNDIIRGSFEDRYSSLLAQCQEELEAATLTIEDRSGMAMSDIRRGIETHMEREQRAGRALECVMIDHLGLIRADDRYRGNRVHEMTQISGLMKDFAREYDIAMIGLCQLSRALENRDNKRPQLSDLRDSGSLEQDADMIGFLFREQYYLEREKGQSQEAESRRIDRLADVQNVLEFNIAKNRNGPVTTVELFFDVACSAVRSGVQRQ